MMKIECRSLFPVTLVALSVALPCDLVGMLPDRFWPKMVILFIVTILSAYLVIFYLCKQVFREFLLKVVEDSEDSCGTSMVIFNVFVFALAICILGGGIAEGSSDATDWWLGVLLLFSVIWDFFAQGLDVLV